MRMRVIRATAGVTAIAFGSLLVGCVDDGGVPAAPDSVRPPVAIEEPVTAPSPSPSQPPTLRPDGDAEDNREYFAFIVDDYVTVHGRGERAALVAHLSAAGFDAAAIDAGWATTPNGLQESSIEAAVRIGDDCLVATIRDSGATTAVLPVLSTGRCLIGDGFDETG